MSLNRNFKIIKQLFYGDIKLQKQATLVVLIEGKKFIPLLLESLKNKKKRARAASFLAFFKIKEAILPIVDILGQKQILSSEKAHLLGVLSELVSGEHAFDERLTIPLRKMQNDNDFLVRGLLAQVYGSLSDIESVNYLKQMIEDQEFFVRKQAKKALNKNFIIQSPNINKPKIFLMLIEALSSLQEITKQKAIKLLGRLTNPIASLPLFLLATSKEESFKIRVLALKALANCLTGVEDFLMSDLLKLAICNCSRIRAAALLCLGRFIRKRKNHMQIIINSFKDSDILVRKCAAIALAESFRSESLVFLPKLIKIYAQIRNPVYIKESVLIALLRINNILQDHKERLILLVKDDIDSKSTQLRKLVIILLDRIIESDNFETKILLQVLRCLEDSDKEIRAVSVLFLSNHLPRGFKGAAEIIGILLKKEKEPLCFLLIDALQRNNTEESYAVLERVSKCSSTMIRLYAKSALEKMENNNW